MAIEDLKWQIEAKNLKEIQKWSGHAHHGHQKLLKGNQSRQ